MPHVEIHLPLDAKTIIRKLRTSEVKSGATSVRFIKKFFTADERMILLDTYVQEAPFDQRLMLAISDRGNSKFLVHVYDTGYPRSTAGVHLAVGHLAKAAIDLDLHGRVVRENLTPSLLNEKLWLSD